MNSRQYLGLWLKEAVTTDLGHKVLRYDGEILVSYCGRSFPAAGAARPLLGMRLCPDCLILYRRHEQDLRKVMAKKENENVRQTAKEAIRSRAPAKARVYEENPRRKQAAPQDGEALAADKSALVNLHQKALERL